MAPHYTHYTEKPPDFSDGFRLAGVGLEPATSGL
jgi:hypothetical protein